MNLRPAPTLDRLSPLLDGLDSWQKYAIWVGNGVLDAYLTDPGAMGWPVPREAAFLLQLPSVVERYQWEALIQEKGWHRLSQTESGFIRYGLGPQTALISTWPGDALLVKSRWIEDACFHATKVTISDGKKLSLLTPPYLVATSLEQLPPPNADLRYSDAFASLVWLFAGREELIDELNTCFYEVRESIRSGLQQLLSHPDLQEALLHVLPAQEWFLSETVIQRMKMVGLPHQSLVPVTEA